MAGYVLPTPFEAGARLIGGEKLNFTFANPIVSTQDAITATPSGTQATALQLVASLNRITVVATAADAVALPKAVAGMRVTVINDSSSGLPMQVFGNSVAGDTINDVATATGISQASGTTIDFYSPIAGKWYTNGLGAEDTAGSGTFIANGVTPVTVANTSVTANSQVLVTLKTVGGTVGTSAPNVRTITPGTGFTIAGIASDTSTYNYAIIG